MEPVALKRAFDLSQQRALFCPITLPSVEQCVLNNEIHFLFSLFLVQVLEKAYEHLDWPETTTWEQPAALLSVACTS